MKATTGSNQEFEPNATNEDVEQIRASPEYLANQMMDMIVYQIIRRMGEMAPKWSQKDLAREMNVSPALISRLLTATTNTSLLTIAKAARALSLSFGALKLVPDEQIKSQVDEFAVFVSTADKAKWWPVTSRFDKRDISERAREYRIMLGNNWERNYPQHGQSKAKIHHITDAVRSLEIEREPIVALPSTEEMGYNNVVEMLEAA